MMSVRELITLTWGLLPKGSRKRGGIILLLILIGTSLEILGVGLVIPVVTLISEPDMANYPDGLEVLNESLGSPAHTTFTIWALGVLLISFYVKNFFLFFSFL